MIKPYLSNIINDHQTRGLVRYHSGNKTWVKETSSNWKIQLTMAVNFISSKELCISNVLCCSLAHFILIDLTNHLYTHQNCYAALQHTLCS